MKTKRIGKNALIMSALALVLCISMLVGTTFAWFTDSVTSKNNIIKSGNLDVVLEYSTDGTTWAAVEETTSLFSEDSLWEPGHTEFVYLRVRNAGTLALKYILSAEVYSETEGTNVAGESFLLSDYLKYGAVKDFTATTREAAVAEAVNAMEAGMDIAGVTVGSIGQSFSENPLQVGQEVETALIITMPTTVGNEANHLTETVAPKITFGVNLYATQLTHEEDSFGPDYDEEATYFAAVDTAEALAEKLVAGESVSLAADLVLDDTTWNGNSTMLISEDVVIDLNGYDLDTSASTRRPFELTNGADLTINGGSETVSVGAYGLVYIPDGASNVTLNGGNYVGNTDKGAFIKPKGDDAITITLNNVNYTDSSANNWLIDGASYAGSDLNVVVNGGTFNVDTGIVTHSGNVTVKDATFNVTQVAFESGYNSVLTIKDSAITVAGGTFDPAAPNACVAVSNDGKATLTNCVLTSDQHVLTIYSTGTTNEIVADGCTITHTGAINAYEIYAGGLGTITVDGAVVAEAF